jgi:hypothetical protein
MSGGGFYGKDSIHGSGREIASPGGAIGQTREVKYGQEENHGFDVAAHSCRLAGCLVIETKGFTL